MLNGRGFTATIAFIVGCALLFWGIDTGKLLFGSWIWGPVFGAVVGIILSIIAVKYADAIILKVARAKPVPSGLYLDAHEAMVTYSRKYRMPVPGFYLSPEILPNFFVFGSATEKCTFVFTQGFLDEARPEFIQAAIAWAMAGFSRGTIQNRTLGSVLAYMFMFPAKLGDLLTMGSGARYNLVNLILLLPLAPVAALIVHLAMGTKHEIYRTDTTTTGITGDQGYLGVTLIEISKKLNNFVVDTDLALIPLFITPPICSNIYFKLFRPFPPLSKRINRLVHQREHARKEMDDKLKGESPLFGG